MSNEQFFNKFATVSEVIRTFYFLSVTHEAGPVMITLKHANVLKYTLDEKFGNEEVIMNLSYWPQSIAVINLLMNTNILHKDNLGMTPVSGM